MLFITPVFKARTCAVITPTCLTCNKAVPVPTGVMVLMPRILTPLKGYAAAAVSSQHSGASGRHAQQSACCCPGVGMQVLRGQW